jgi:nucleoside-diphosphate-sugar epimerase
VKANLASFDKVSKFEIYNIGSGQESSLLNLCSKIIEFTKSVSKVKYSKEPAAFLSLDISKAKRDLNYEPKILEHGLMTYIDHIREH